MAHTWKFGLADCSTLTASPFLTPQPDLKHVEQECPESVTHMSPSNPPPQQSPEHGLLGEGWHWWPVCIWFCDWLRWQRKELLESHSVPHRRAESSHVRSVNQSRFYTTANETCAHQMPSISCPLPGLEGTPSRTWAGLAAPPCVYRQVPV